MLSFLGVPWHTSKELYKVEPKVEPALTVLNGCLGEECGSTVYSTSEGTFWRGGLCANVCSGHEVKAKTCRLYKV